MPSTPYNTPTLPGRASTAQSPMRMASDENYAVVSCHAAMHMDEAHQQCNKHLQRSFAFTAMKRECLQHFPLRTAECEVRIFELCACVLQEQRPLGSWLKQEPQMPSPASSSKSTSGICPQCNMHCPVSPHNQLSQTIIAVPFACSIGSFCGCCSSAYGIKHDKCNAQQSEAGLTSSEKTRSVRKCCNMVYRPHSMISLKKRLVKSLAASQL